MTLLSVLFLVAVSFGCVSNMPPVVDPAVASLRPRPIVIFVTGITGSILYDRVDDRVAWGDARSAFLPRDGGYATARPIGPVPDRIEAGEPIMQIRIGPLYRKELYRPLVTTFEANGYTTGADFIPFGYDWRMSNVESARRLARLVDDVGGERPIVLICQSNGGYLCRWAVRFGDVSLDEAERGVFRPIRARVESLIFVGTTHAGSIRILREMDRGRTYVRLGRFLSPELFFTFESLYQDLPPWRDDLFVDESGRPIDVNLFDASTWERYGWSIFRRDSAARADQREDLFGRREDRLRFLQGVLDDARRFHALLRDGPPPEGVRYYSIQNRTRRTIDRAMLVRHDSRWETLFIGDEYVDARPEIAAKMMTMGDIHAGAESQEALPPAEKALMAEPVIEVDGDHLGVVQSAVTRREILRIVAKGGG